MGSNSFADIANLKILLIVDSLRIGGIERNALDQLYLLSDFGNHGVIVLLRPKDMKNNANFLEAEKNLINEKDIEIRYLEGKLLQRIIEFARIQRQVKPDLIIDYSLLGTVLARIATVVSCASTTIHCVVQQFPGLSAPRQRMKRFIYSQFANKIFINSFNYSLDWNRLRNSSSLGRILFSKKTQIIRNGVYLPRLNVVDNFTSRSAGSVPRFVYLGRLKEWKGIKNFEEIDRAVNSQCEFYVVAPDVREDIVARLKGIFGQRISFSFGKSLSAYSPEGRDIHVYPVDYGSSIPFVESVSTNCLEMALLGVPSLVTKYGTKNWPELVEAGVIHEVDWSDIDSVRNGVKSCYITSVEKSKFQAAVRAIDIQNNLKLHVKFSKESDFGRKLNS